ncbi:MAG: hypothetical protein EOP49_54285, partial [Sphingobacteriales bacterium]
MMLSPQNCISLVIVDHPSHLQITSTAGLSRYIESYVCNQFPQAICSPNVDSLDGVGAGLLAEYYNNQNFEGTPVKVVIDGSMSHDPPWALEAPTSGVQTDHFSIRWTGRIKAPQSGTFSFQTASDDGVRFWINDSLIIDNWGIHGSDTRSASVSLLAGEFYRVRIEYFDFDEAAGMHMHWQLPGTSGYDLIPASALYTPAPESYTISNYLVKERRVNQYRKAHHISEITVLNTDGRRYIYGIPVYNLRQKEVTFAVNAANGNRETGLVSYSSDDNSVGNMQGKDRFYQKEETPAYA